MSLPNSYAEYAARTAEHLRYSGFGLATTIHAPCPFCAAADWLAAEILDTERKFAAGAVCRECGRGARVIYARPGDGSVRMEIVQTSGPDQPDWLTPEMRREPAAPAPSGS